MKHFVFLSLLLAICSANKLRAQPPAFDHIVIVIEENHSFSDIIGSADAQNINALAASGANIVNASTDPNGNTSGSHAVRHPSQPNYLELYSGSNRAPSRMDTPARPASHSLVRRRLRRPISARLCATRDLASPLTRKLYHQSDSTATVRGIISANIIRSPIG